MIKKKGNTRDSDEEYDPSDSEYSEIEDGPLMQERKRVSRKKSFDSECDDEDDEYEGSEIQEESENEVGDLIDENDFDIKDLGVKEIKVGKKRKASTLISHPRESVKDKSKIVKKTKVSNRGKENKENTSKDKVKKAKAPKAAKLPKAPKVPKELLSSTFNLTTEYFYQQPTESEWNEIRKFIRSHLTTSQVSKFPSFFGNYPKLKKGGENSEKLLKITDEISSEISRNRLSAELFQNYKSLNSYINSTFFQPKPSISECYFFPNTENEIYVVNMLRTCKISLDIAIFTLTNDRIAAAIEEAFKRGVRVRVIADDECCKMWGSDIYYLASIGIDVKTDNAVRYHMHHKLAILDESVVVTGSFNWTAQAVKYNQENIIFLENKEIAKKYTQEFDRLWNSFDTVITKTAARKLIIEDEARKKDAADKRRQEREAAKQQTSK